MATYTIIDPHGGTLSIENDGSKHTLVVRADPHPHVRVVLSNFMMRELAYHCALWYAENSGVHVLNPGGYNPEHGAKTVEAKAPDHSQTPKALLPLPKVRMRVRPA